MEKQGNKGQGDSLEGVFLATKQNDNSDFINNMKKNDNVEYFNNSNLLYFRNKNIKDLYCLCLYGLNSNMFIIKEEDRFEQEHYIAKVDKKYFMDFSGGISEEEYHKKEENDKPVVLFINNPHLFFNKIKSFFMNLDVKEEDIIISPVEYIDLRKEFISFVPNPYELLLKDKDFINQSEVRIIINSNSEKLKRYMEENNNIIDIGNIQELVTIYDNYYHDLLIEKRGNALLFTLPFPVNEELSKSTLRELLSYYVQIINDKLPYEITSKEKEDILNEIDKIINEKYGINLRIINGNISLSNVNGNIEELLEK